MENERNKVVYSILSSRGLSGKVSLYRRSIGKLPRFLLLRSVRMKWTSPSRIFFLLASTSRFAIPRVQEPFHPRIIAPFRTSLVNDSIETKILNEKLEKIRESTITFNRNTGLKFTHRMPRGRGDSRNFRPETDTCAERKLEQLAGAGGSRAVRSATVLNEKCGMVAAAFLKRRGRNGNMQTSNGVAVVRDGYWTRAPDSTLRAEF